MAQIQLTKVDQSTMGVPGSCEFPVVKHSASKPFHSAFPSMKDMHINWLIDYE